MECEKPRTLTCAVVAIDHTTLFYRVCSVCERTLPHDLSLCRSCDYHHLSSTSSSSSKRLFRLLISVASDTNVFPVLCFDRAARVLFGCSADDFFDFAKLHPFAAVTAGEVLEGELFRVTLSKPKNGNAQHLRATTIIPLRTGFQPAIQILREVYKVKSST